MAKSMAREKRPHNLDTEDHVTERVLEAVSWAEQHRRLVIGGGIVLVAAVAAAFYYRDYQERLVETASVRFQELQMSTRSADLATIREELGLFIDQYPGTQYADQARVVLADLELRRDSLQAAIRTLEPLVDLGSGNPLAFTAAGMIASAYEQGGDADRALRWYDRVAEQARFDYQRREAMADQARLHTVAGRYSEAISVYEQLVAETDDDPAGQSMYRVRLGEVRALAVLGSAPPAAVPAVPGGEDPVDEADAGDAEAEAADAAPEAEEG